MKVKFIYPQWGSTHVELSKFLEKIKKAGYSGVELGLPLDKKERNSIVSMVNEFELDLVAQHYHTDNSHFNMHRNSYERHLNSIVEIQPLFINSHTGKDFFSFSQNAELLKVGQEIEEETGIMIVHETHRSRFSFAAHICKEYLKEFPFLKLTSDFSHWCNVAESMLADQKEAVDLAIEHTFHVHARVGSAQSAQVIDPRDEAYKSELIQFKKWWKEMIKSSENRGLDELTFVPEYGPFPYSLYKPGSRELLADQWTINQFIKNEILENCFA